MLYITKALYLQKFLTIINSSKYGTLMKNIIDNPQFVETTNYQILYHAGFKNTRS
jgi:hypothetical protein